MNIFHVLVLFYALVLVGNCLLTTPARNNNLLACINISDERLNFLPVLSKNHIYSYCFEDFL